MNNMYVSIGFIIIGVLLVGVAGFAIGVKMDANFVRKCAKLGTPYVIGEKVYEIRERKEGER